MKWLLILSGLIVCTGKQSSSCPLEMSPSRVVVRFGAPILANCSSLTNQTVSMGWESMVGGTGLVDGVTSVSLVINSVENWALAPICYINLQGGDQCAKTLPVTVYKIPESVSMSVPGTMVEGEAYIMWCTIDVDAPKGNLSVHWYKGNEIVHTEIKAWSQTLPFNGTATYHLTAQRGDNGTQMWCEAKMNFWPPVPNVSVIRSKSHDMIVLYSPTFTKPENEMLELTSGSKLILDCTAIGNPTPVYSWHFPHAIQRTNQNEDQPIQSPSIELPGTYNCTASNTQGSNTKYFTVIEATRNRTTFAALVGGFVFLGAVLLIGGLFFVTPEGTFSFCKGSYQKGRPTSSGPV